VPAHRARSCSTDSILLIKAIQGFFNIVNRKTRFSIDFHFRWLAATENGGTSLYRAQLVEKRCFSTNR
jgi:hypothetical protein